MTVESNYAIAIATLGPRPHVSGYFLIRNFFCSGHENIRVHMLCDHSVFISNSPIHTYLDSLRTHLGLKKLSHQAHGLDLDEPVPGA